MSSKKFYLITIIVLIVLELTLFNINSYRVLFDDNTQDTYDFINMVYDVNIENINSEVKTIYVDFVLKDYTNTLDYSIAYSDSTTKSRTLPLKTYFSSNERTKYTAVYLSHNVKSIELNFDKDQVRSVSITLNKHIPMHFSIVRIVVLFLIVALVRSYNHCDFWNEELNNNTMQKVITCMVIVFAVIVVIFASKNDANLSYSNLYNVKFVDSIEAGSLSLLEKPSDKLLSLKNPYDAVERRSLTRDVDYIWDAALYNGNYYVYYGILPALLLFVPYHLMTGMYLPTYVGVAIFSILSIWALALIVKLFYKKYFSNMPFRIYIVGLVSALFGVGIIWVNAAPRFYEVVTIAGFYFTLQGLYLLWSVDLEKDKFRLRLFLAALCLSLAVACRPTFLLASIFVIIWFIKYIKNNKSGKVIRLLITIAIPYIVVGGLLMAYNKARFGSPFDFGSKYQLTMNDMRFTNMIMALPQGILCNLFNIPHFIGTFPFIQVNNEVLDYYGYYYIEDMAAGLFFMAPICFALFRIIKVFKWDNKKEDKLLELKNRIIELFIIGTILLVIVTSVGGSLGRYLLDFSWCYVLASILISWDLYNRIKTAEGKKIYTKILTYVMIYILIFNVLSIFLKANGLGMKELSPSIYLKIEQLILFWK